MPPSLLERLDEVVECADPGEVRKDLDGTLMHLIVKGGAAVVEDYHRVTEVGGVAGCPFNYEAGGHPGQYPVLSRPWP